MNLAELKRRIQTADWFANLGHAQQRGGNIAITSPNQWKQFIAALNGIEFGLAHDMAALTTYPLAAFDWLPASIHDGDQVQSKALIEIARANGKEAEFKATRLEIFKLGQVSLRSVSEQPLLIVGSANMNEAARGAALFACRMAAAEIVVERPDFWCSLIPVYHDGNWPFGRTPTGEILVL